MELLLHGSDASSSDGLVAASAEGTPHCVIMDLTIRDAIMVEETATVEWHAALPADKTVWVPLHIQGSYVIIHDGTMATSTLGGKHVKVVLGAVSLAVLLVEAVFAKVLAALSAEEMFWMPGLFQGSDART